jgi:hypothetical protein
LILGADDAALAGAGAGAGALAAAAAGAGAGAPPPCDARIASAAATAAAAAATCDGTQSDWQQLPKYVSNQPLGFSTTTGLALGCAIREKRGVSGG